MGQISIDGMEFYAYHGCYMEEQVIGTRFTVDVILETDTREAEKTDDLYQTVNYQSVYRMVKEEMAVKSNLLEHIARRISDRIKRDFPQVSACRVKVSKLNPPLGGKVQSVSIELYDHLS